MAPITDVKRTQAQAHNSSNGTHQHNHHIHHSNQASKENANNSAKQSKKGLEILDFHESWLEEMEIYKDQMCRSKHQQQQQQPQQHSHAHYHQNHHAHTLQGCQLELHNANNSNNIRLSSSINAAANNFDTNSTTTSSTITAAAVAAASASTSATLNANPNSNTKRKDSEHTNISALVAQNRVPKSAASEPKQNGIGSVQLILKRPREEVSASKSTTPATASTNNNTSSNSTKRYAHSNAHAHTINPSQTHNQAAPLKTAGIAANPAQSVNVGKPIAAKVIVNQFHASSLFSSQQQDEKAKILTQNGLNKSAANALETSLYASNYLPQEQQNQNTRNVLGAYNGARYNDYANYVGVSQAKNDIGDGERNRDTHSHTPYDDDDDPCTAIDDVNCYTDSDSEEEYTGYPFYLKADDNELPQSRNIRLIEQSSDDADTEDATTNEKRSIYHTPSHILTPSLFPNVAPYLNFSSHSGKGPGMPAALHKVLKWKLSPIMPKIVKRVVLNSGFRIIKNTTDWMAIWEKQIKSPGFRTIRSHQKYNHMPGSFRIGRKDTMWRSIYTNMHRFGAKEFGFMQKSYVMPDDLESLRQVWPRSASKLAKWIVKPPASARGTGIRIVNKWSQFPKDRPLVVQKYIERPLLINDNKFDMRIYVLITSVNPLRIYMYKDGLARFASVKYSSELNSLDDRCMHLTNYSINKFSQNYSKNEDVNACQGHKWTLQSLWSCLESRGVNTKRLWATLRNLVIKALVSGESGLNRMYRQNINFRYNCFELFGFDILLDENLIPWLLEINISPSLHSELPLDWHVKGPLIQAVLNTVLYQVPPKLNETQQQHIMDELKLQGPLCYDRRLFTTCLTAEEVRKHNHFTSRSIEFREEYVDAILENVLPDDVRCLILSEDELARCTPLERIFPTPDTHIYMKYFENPRYYNRLLDAWEHRYGHCREQGIAWLQHFCKEGYHLQVSEATLEKEPDVALTEIDLLHVKKTEDDTSTALNTDSNTAESAHASKAGSPDSTADAALEAASSLATPTTSTNDAATMTTSSATSTKTCSKESDELALKPTKKQQTTTSARSYILKVN